jgi:hypothetical protein
MVPCAWVRSPVPGPFSMSTPKYSGATDLKTFEQWVLSIVQWFRLHTLLGPGTESDRTRVNMIGYLCEGAARDWFHYEVETATGGPEAWTTLEVVQGLQARFITQRSAAEVANEFCTLSQGTMDAQELYQELRHLVLQLPHVPDTYTFTSRYVEALNPRIAGHVYTMGYTAETHEVEVLAKMAEYVEGAIRAQRHYEDNCGSVPAVKKTREKGKGVTAQSAKVETTKPTVAPTKAWGETASWERQRGAPGCKGACHKCGRMGHFAAQCTERMVAGKAAAIEERLEDKSVPDIPAAQLEPESEYDDGESSLGDEEPPRGSASGGHCSSIDSLWDHIEGTYSVQGRVCSIVPIEEDIEGRRVEANQPPHKEDPSEVHNLAAQRQPEPGHNDRTGQPIRVPKEQKPLTGYY